MVFTLSFAIICDMKKIIIIVMVLTLLPSVSFWYMEAKLFCRINQNVIKVSLSPQDGSKCKSYIAYMEQTMRQTAKDLYTIQWYINRRQDVEYRTQVKKEKLASIDTLQWLRLNIIDSMKSFESALLKKLVDYFLLKNTPYLLQLTKSLSKLSLLTGDQPPEVTRLYTLMSWQVQTLEKISKVQTIEELIPLLNGYIYFKQQISWKSE